MKDKEFRFTLRPSSLRPSTFFERTLSTLMYVLPLSDRGRGTWRSDSLPLYLPLLPRTSSSVGWKPTLLLHTQRTLSSPEISTIDLTLRVLSRSSTSTLDRRLPATFDSKTKFLFTSPLRVRRGSKGGRKRFLEGEYRTSLRRDPDVPVRIYKLSVNYDTLILRSQLPFVQLLSSNLC